MAHAHFVPHLRADQVHRSVLVEAALSQPAPLTVLDAAGGMGKTVLASQIAHEAARRGTETVWVSFSRDQHECDTAWDLIVDTLASAGVVRPGQLTAPAPGDPFTERNAWYPRAEIDELLLVIDDHHLIWRPDSRFTEFVTHALEAAPRVRMLICGRDLSGLGSDPLRSRLAARVFDDAALAFTETEVAQLVRRMRPDADADAAARITRRVHRRLRGWPAATQAALAMPHGLHAEDHSAHVNESFPRAVLRRRLREADPASAAAIHAVAFAGELSAEVWSRVAATEIASPRVLPHLSTDLLLSRRDADGTVWYRHHDAVREHVRRMPDHGSTVADSVEADRMIALLHAYDPALALPGAGELGRWDEVDRILHADFTEAMLAPGGPLAPLLPQIPRDVMRDYPLFSALETFEEMYRPRGREGLILAKLQRIMIDMEPFTADDGPHGVVASAARLTAACFAGEPALIRTMSDRIDDILTDLSGEELRRAERTLASAANQQASGLFYLGEFDRAEAITRRVTTTSTTGVTSAVLRAMAMSALIAAWRGDMRTAGIRLRACESAFAERTADDLASATAPHAVARALWLRESGRYEDAAGVVAHLLSDDALAFEFWPYVVWLDTVLIESMIGPHDALARLKRHLELRSPHAPLLSEWQLLLDELRARLSFRLSMIHFETDLPAGENLVGAYRALAEGDPHRAANIAAGVAVQSTRRGDSRRQLHALLVGAEAEAATEEGGAASDLTAHAAALAETCGLRTTVIRPSSGPADATEAAIATPYNFRALSPAEVRALREVDIAGNAVRAARSLFLSPHTVRDQLKSAYRKLGVSNRQEAIQVAYRVGILGATAAEEEASS